MRRLDGAQPPSQQRVACESLPCRAVNGALSLLAGLCSLIAAAERIGEQAQAARECTAGGQCAPELAECGAPIEPLCKVCDACK
jgi:hypothetical protein